VDRFIARENIKHFHEILLSDIDRGERSRVQKLLIEEIDKLGKDLELLADIERHIADANRRIAAQRLRVEVMQRDGQNSVESARAFLEGMMESQRLFANYHQLVAREVQRGRILDR